MTNREKTSNSISLMIILFGLIAYSQSRSEEFCYEPYGEGVHPEFIADVSMIRVRWLLSERGTEASASYYYDKETNYTVCVITVRMPDQVLGDPDMDSLGHEFLHCLTGDFHDEDH